MLRQTLAAPHAAALTLLLAVSTGKSCDHKKATLPPASPDNGGLVLPGGFEAVVVHDGVGRARHLAVTDDGIVYVKLRVPAPKGLVALRDGDGDGRAEQMQVFGDYNDTGDYGTAMRIHAGHIYFTTAAEVYRRGNAAQGLVPGDTGSSEISTAKVGMESALRATRREATSSSRDSAGSAPSVASRTSPRRPKGSLCGAQLPLQR